MAPTPNATVEKSQAPWAFVLALGGAVLSIVGWMAWLGSFFALVLEQAGPNPTQEQVNEIMGKMMSSGQSPTMNAATLLILLVGMVCSLSGLVLAVRSILRSPERRGLAIAACIISVCFLVCQVIPMLTALTAQQTT